MLGLMGQTGFVSAPRVRLVGAIALGVVSAVGSIALLVADGAHAGVGWSHHAGVSAAPLLMISGAIAAATVARSHTAGSVVKALVGVVAFAAWGLAQMVPSPTAAGLLGDVAILLFVLDAFSIIVTDARSVSGPGSLALGRGTGLDPRPVDSSPRSSQDQRHQRQGGRSTAQVCCVRSAEPCACVG
jgi:hypothetical protein